MCLIWKESIQNCRCYRTDRACGTDGRTDGRTDGQTDEPSETSIPPPTTSLCEGYDNRAPLLYYIKLCASFQIHRLFKTEVTVRKRSIRVKIGDFLFRVTLKFDGWPWKTIGHLFYTTSSFVHHFKAMSEFKLKLQSGNALFGSKSAIICPVWPWNLMDYLGKQ